MFPSEYQKLAARTETVQFKSRFRINGSTTPFPEDYHAGANDYEPLKCVRALHSAIGLMGELGELAGLLGAPVREDKDVVDEVGDAMWYVALGCNALDIDMNQLMSNVTGLGFLKPAPYNFVALVTASGLLASEFQRWLYYGKYDVEVPGVGKCPGNRPDVPKIADHYRHIVNGLAVMIPKGYNWSDVMTANVAKLQKRYPDKYSDLRAAEENRDRAAEADAISAQIDRA